MTDQQVTDLLHLIQRQRNDVQLELIKLLNDDDVRNAENLTNAVEFFQLVEAALDDYLNDLEALDTAQGELIELRHTVEALERENAKLENDCEEYRDTVRKLEQRVKELENKQ